MPPEGRSRAERSSSRISSTRRESARRTARGSTPIMSRSGTPPSCNEPSTRGADRRQGQPPRVRLGRARCEPLVRHRPQPAPSREDDGRLVGGKCGRDRGRARRARDRDRHRLLDQAARGRVWNRRPQVAVGAAPARRRVPALPLARHGRADGADGRGRRAPLVGARRERGARAAPRRPHRRAVAAGAGSR